MTAPHFHGTNRIVPASSLLSCIGEVLADIKREHGLTWAEIGAVMHKSDDRAALYASGEAEMGVIAYLRLKHQFGQRFAGPVNALLSGAGDSLDVRELARGAVALTRFIGELQEMLLDGEVSNAEVIAAAPLIAEANAVMAAINRRLAEAMAAQNDARGG